MPVLLLLSAAHATPTYTPPQELVWPSGDTVTPDVVVWVVQHEVADPPQLIRSADGVSVPLVVYEVPSITGDTWLALDPVELLQVGDYSLSLAGDGGAFSVVEGTAAVAEPPIPFRRMRAAGCEWGGELTYRVCDGGQVHVAAWGDAAPPVVSLDDPGPAVVVGTGMDDLRLELGLDVSGGWSGTVWIGSFDDAGRFTGWWDGDEVTVEADELWHKDGPAGTSTTPGVTPTGVAECPVFTGWDEIETLDCAEVRAQTTTECGCASATGSWVGGWLAALALVARRRVTARS